MQSTDVGWHQQARSAPASSWRAAATRSGCRARWYTYAATASTWSWRRPHDRQGGLLRVFRTADKGYFMLRRVAIQVGDTLGMPGC